VRSRAALACLATIAVADYVIRRRTPRWIVIGLLDHPAHVATAMLLRPRWNREYLAGSLLPDLDHIPLALQRIHPSPGDPRPMSHCLLAVAPVAAVSQSAAAGMLAHFARDLAIGTGVPLLWPATERHFRLPYPLYLAGCFLLARRATLVAGL
jgi:inner membrane protein